MGSLGALHGLVEVLRGNGLVAQSLELVGCGHGAELLWWVRVSLGVLGVMVWRVVDCWERNDLQIGRSSCRRRFSAPKGRSLSGDLAQGSWKALDFRCLSMGIRACDWPEYGEALPRTDFPSTLKAGF